MSSLTNERLRYWLSTNQASRERLCAGLLPLLGDYSDLRPRRPEGGPDGGRDLDATYKRQIPAAVAIGFRNNVRDDEDDKRWVRTKAAADATSAKGRTQARHFVFMTNVDLTPTEVEQIGKSIFDAGFGSCDVVYRERLRLVLDSPEGFALRATHLQIPLDVAEQATFFSKFAEKINGDTSSDLLQRLARLELRQELERTVERFRIRFSINGAKWWHLFSGCPFQLSVIRNFRRKNPAVRSMNIVFRRAKRTGRQKQELRWIAGEGRLLESENGISISIKDTIRLPIFSQAAGEIEFIINVADILPTPNGLAQLGAFDDTWWFFEMPADVASCITEVAIEAESWVLVRSNLVASGRSVGTQQSPSFEIGLWPENMHLRERVRPLTSYSLPEIDFRRISPVRVWDRRKDF